VETQIGKTLQDLANLAAERWYAMTGLTGLVILGSVLTVGSPQDDLLVALIGGAMAAGGFAEGETRSHRQYVDEAGRWMITAPLRRVNGPALALYALCIAAAAGAVLRLATAAEAFQP
jgi:hypothetical protein